MNRVCVRCGAAPAIDGAFGTCGHCFWAIKGEVVEGIWQLEQYLARWSHFADWCSVHRAPSPST